MKLSPLTRSLICIGVYIVLFSLADSLSAQIGIEKLITAPVSLLLSVLLFILLRREGSLAYHGLCSTKALNARRLLYFVPFALLATVNLLYGVRISHSAVEIVLHIITMLCVGFLEEMIFRGLLFRAIEKDGAMQAVIICGVTFGIGHIVNLLNGADFFPTLLQVCYAVAAGLCFTMFFHKTRNLVPCILCHGVLNSLSIFAAEPSASSRIVGCLFLTIVSLGYFFYLLKTDHLVKNHDTHQTA